jgi:hypothetical protein
MSKTDLKLNVDKTGRGFRLIEFEDAYADKCSLQKSSLATEDAIWLGIQDADPKLMASDAERLGKPDLPNSGGDSHWRKWPIPDEVSLSTRMHLTKENVEELLPYLNFFAITGALPSKKIGTDDIPVVEPINFADEDNCDAKAARIEHCLREAERLQGHLHDPNAKMSDDVKAEKLAGVQAAVGEIVAAFGLKLAE